MYSTCNVGCNSGRNQSSESSSVRKRAHGITCSNFLKVGKKAMIIFYFFKISDHGYFFQDINFNCVKWVLLHTN